MRWYIAAMLLVILIPVCVMIGQHRQMYDFVDNDDYSALYYSERSDAFEKFSLKVAAIIECDGELEEDFSCATPGEAGYEG